MKNILGRPCCKISVLAGNIGDSFVKLYQVAHPDYTENIHSCPHLGFSLEADARTFSLWVSSSDKAFPLYKGDSVRLKFEDNRYMQITFSVGGQQIGREKRNIALLSDFEILQLLECPLIEAEVSNYKSGTSSIYNFSTRPTSQYTGGLEGGKLIQVVVKRILGARQMLNSLPN